MILLRLLRMPCSCFKVEFNVAFRRFMSYTTAVHIFGSSGLHPAFSVLEERNRNLRDRRSP